MLLFGPHLRRHRLWIGIFIGGTALAVLWYVIAAAGASRLPGGSSPVGFTLGVAAGLIIFFEMLLWPRKKFRHGRIGPLKFGPVRAWMRAHIWLGLLAVPFAVLHCGFTLGGPLPTVLMILFLAVIASGVWGLYVQNVLPSRMFDEVPGETIASQIPKVMAQHAHDARVLIERVCGVEAGVPVPDDEETFEGRRREAITVEAYGSVGKVQGKVLVTIAGLTEAEVQGAEPLVRFFHEDVEGYLRHGEETGSPLRSPTQANRMFADVRGLVPAVVHPVVDVLRSKVELRRQLDTQERLTRRLHGWLLVHLPLSVALTILLVVHIWSALKYW